MSLTSILNTKEARAFLRDLIRNPRISPRPPTLVPRTASSPSRVGTAFDYALRFGLAGRGFTRKRTTVDLVAHEALEHMRQLMRFYATHAARGRRCYPDPAVKLKEIESAYALARETYLRALGAVGKFIIGRFANREKLRAEAADACYRLAALDVVYRAGRLEQLRQPTSKAEVAELQELYRIVPWESFKPRRRLLLNPTFGDGSDLVGGADADLVVDDTVIEVKTIAEQTLRLEAVRQLVGYALLANAYGIDGAMAKIKVIRAGIYLSRAGYLHVFRLSDAIDGRHHRTVLRYLAPRRRARPS